MKRVIMLSSFLGVCSVINACPTCVGTVEGACPPFFSASCYSAVSHDDNNDQNNVKKDLLTLEEEKDHDKK